MSKVEMTKNFKMHKFQKKLFNILFTFNKIWLELVETYFQNNFLEKNWFGSILKFFI